MVKFIEGGTLYYVDWDILEYAIEFLRSFDPLEKDIDSTIKYIIANA